MATVRGRADGDPRSGHRRARRGRTGTLPTLATPSHTAGSLFGGGVLRRVVTGTDVATAELAAYLSEALDVAVAGTAVLEDGLNLTVAVSTAADGRAYVVRRPRKLRDAGYLLDPEREYRVLQRLEATAVPAPTPVLFCDDESVLGAPFLVATYLDGEVVPLGADLPRRFRDADSRRRVADRLVDSLAGVHSVAVGPFEDVCERLSPREQVDRAVERLDETARVTGRELPALRSAAAWLRRNAPSDPETVLVHGDFRPGNVLFAGTDRPAVAGVIDWETALLGDPLTELGYLLVRWRDDGDPTPSVEEIEARHPDADAIAHLREVNERGLAPFTARPGSPDRRAVVARYEAATGRSFEDDRFYRAHALLLLATVWEDLHRHRVAAGEESDWPPHVEYLALLATSIVEGEFPL